jgi:hypothetical protein
MSANTKRVRLPAAQERAIKDYRRACVMQILDMDTLYSRRGEWLSPYAVGILTGVSKQSACYLLSSMSIDRILVHIQRTVRSSNSGTENIYKVRPKSMLSVPWRQSSNRFTGSPHYQRLGVPI